jgi:hypothetical protein
MPRRTPREKLAAELQTEKENLRDWEVVSSQSPREPSVSISLRLPPDDADLLQEKAAEQKTSVSAVVRVAIHRYLDPAHAPAVRFVFVGPTKFSDGSPGPFTEARQNRSESPEHQVIRLSA